jgi:hypothetical protein
MGDMERVLLPLHQSIMVLLHWRCGSNTYNVVDSSGDLVLPEEQIQDIIQYDLEIQRRESGLVEIGSRN